MTSHRMIRNYMRLKIITFFLLIAVGALSFKAFRPVFANVEAQRPRIVIDPTPLDRQTAPHVTSYADILDGVRPAVVSIVSARVVVQRPWQPFGPFGDDPIFRRFFGIPEQQPPREQRRHGLGSGVIISSEGYVLTNNHVIDGADEIKVRLADGREVDATVVGTDPQTDVAVLKIESENLPVAVLADSDQIRVGDIVFALGNPLGVGQTVTMGIVSATGRQQIGILGREGYEDFIQTDAAINQGNSGGPLVDAEGRVIGINTAILTRTGGNIGIGFAIPINMVATVMKSLIETGMVERGFLGVEIQDVTSAMMEDFGLTEARGAVIVRVTPGSPAEQAGLRHGDVIARVNDRPVDNTQQLRLVIAQIRPGTPAKLEIVRDGARETFEVEIGRLDPSRVAEAARGTQELLTGIRVSPVTSEIRRELDLPENLSGLAVVGVDDTSPHAATLPLGTVIVEINRRAVDNIATARQLLRDGANTFYIYMNGAFRFEIVNVTP